MTKKHFIALADFIRSKACFTLATIEALAEFLEAQNPRFKHERWIGYIKGENGPNGGKVRIAIGGEKWKALQS